MIAAVRTRWVTFDCFGTLVDWHTGFAQVLDSLFGAKARAVLREYHEFERLYEAERPHLSYREVLASALSRAAETAGAPMAQRESESLADAWDAMPIFSDVERMLGELRAMGCRLAVLTNCDDDLFARTHRTFLEPFDLVVTAEQVRDYKPSLSHFRYFDRVSGVGVGDWIHVACSWSHDIVPAKKLGIRSVWLDRDNTGDDPAAATMRVRSALDVPAAIARL